MDLDKQGDIELMNWARYVNDSWLRDNVMFSVLPTSEGYLADIVAYDDPEPAQMPIDEIAAIETEGVVVRIGLSHFDYYMVLVHWYPRLMMLRRDGEPIITSEALKRLSIHMHTSARLAQWMLKNAVNLYGTMRLTKSDNVCNNHRRAPVPENKPA